jgi:hypothetical protein
LLVNFALTKCVGAEYLIILLGVIIFATRKLTKPGGKDLSEATQWNDKERKLLISNKIKNYRMTTLVTIQQHILLIL